MICKCDSNCHPIDCSEPVRVTLDIRRAGQKEMAVGRGLPFCCTSETIVVVCLMMVNMRFGLNLECLLKISTKGNFHHLKAMERPVL